MTEQQKKEIENIWNSKIEDGLYGFSVKFRPLIDVIFYDKGGFSVEVGGRGVVVEMEANSKIQATLKTLGWIE